MSWDGINPVHMSRSVRTVLFHGQNESHFVQLMTNTSGGCYSL